MWLKFRDWKISTKIFVSFITLIILFLFMLGQSYLAISGIINKQIPLLLANEEVKIAMLEMRKNEKDFLMREVTNQDFFKEGKSSYLEKHKDNYERLNKNIGFIKENSDIAENAELIEKLDKVLAEAKLYQDNFLKVVEKRKERGFQDYGLEGELRKAIHDIEQSIKSEDQIILMLQARRAEKDYFLRHDLKYVEKLSGIVADLKTSLQASGNNQEIKLLEEYHKKINEVVAIEREIGLTEDEGINGTYRQAIHKLDPLLADLSTDILSMSNTYAENSQRIIIALFVIIFIIAVLFSMLISKLITKPINKANFMLKDISEGEGDLTSKLTIDSKDELGSLSLWFNVFTNKIKDIIVLVQNNALIISESSNELAVASEQSNKGIEKIVGEVSVISNALAHNASVIEEATASIQEISHGAIIVSQESEDAANNSVDALEAAKYGEEKLKKVGEVIDSVYRSSNNAAAVIEELKASSIKISEIASLITRIAEQTNLLALNAAIEAARAGENGRGFTVVADEVRKLAEESKRSAYDITNLINGVEKEIEIAHGAMQKEQELVTISVEKVKETEEDFENIVKLMEKTANKIFIISQAAKQQSDITKDMTKAMNEISDSTQESAAASQQISSSIQDQFNTFEEISASIGELSNISKVLREQADRFKTK
jgi:methyl-accepting chemotaxis protein